MLIALSVSDDDVELMESDDDEQVPMVSIGESKIPLTDVTPELIAKMTPAQKDAYVQLYQEYYQDD